MKDKEKRDIEVVLVDNEIVLINNKDKKSGIYGFFYKDVYLCSVSFHCSRSFDFPLFKELLANYSDDVNSFLEKVKKMIIQKINWRLVEIMERNGYAIYHFSFDGKKLVPSGKKSFFGKVDVMIQYHDIFKNFFVHTKFEDSDLESNEKIRKEFSRINYMHLKVKELEKKLDEINQKVFDILSPVLKDKLIQSS